jgi:hypothetical protein
VDAIDGIFTLLDRWRHLPKYQLERRADIFFAFYLCEFLQERFAVPLRPQLIPEFPIHLRSLGYPVTGDSSCNVDFLAVAQDLRRAFFVELKTDSLSRRDVQDTYLVDAQRTGLPRLLEGVVQITRATARKSKYLHLLLLLHESGLVHVPAALAARLRAGNLRGLSTDLDAIQTKLTDCPIQIVYLQPTATAAASEIGFADLAQWMARFDDPLSARFRESLTRWSASVAGEALEE